MRASPPAVSRIRVGKSWLDRPLSGPWCAIGWIVATALFIGLVRLVGGPSEGDAAESIYSTWAIAHGHLSCAYPPATTFRFPTIARPATAIAPLWPLLSGGFTALTGIGHSVPFPSQSALGPHCSTAFVAMYRWAIRSGAPASTVRLGYLSWLALMAGVVALLRSVGRGRCGWEPTTLVVLACVPTVWAPVVQYFHPQDLVAMGLILGALSCVRKARWGWAGILLGLAVMSQQFALLVLAPLVLVAPVNRWIRFVGSAIAAAVVLVAPLVAVGSARVLKAVVFGSGNSPGDGGTVLWELHLHGELLVAVSRVLPIVLSMVLARCAKRRLGAVLLEPAPLLSLIAVSLSLRLVFEQNFFGYYLMALAVSLVLLDVVHGRIRAQLVAWLGFATVVFSPVPWGFVSNGVAWGLQEREFLPFLLMAVVLVLIVRDIANRRIRWYLVAWFVLVAAFFARVPWTNPPLRHPASTWVWQIALVISGSVLAARPLFSSLRGLQTSDGVQPDNATDASENDGRQRSTLEGVRTSLTGVSSS
jgi:hypothetical protein